MGFRRLSDFIRQFDWLLAVCLTLLIGVGLLMLYSVALGREGGDLSLVTKQFIIAGIGLICFFVFSLIDYQFWRAASIYLYLATLIVLLAVLFFGQTINATQGWFIIGGWQLQPVEFAKFVMVIVLGAFFARRARALGQLMYVNQSFFFMALVAGLVLLQPDFGSAALFFALWLGLLLIIGRVKRRYVIILFAAMAIMLAIGWLFFFKQYQKDRLTTFLFPEARSAAQSYNVRQAIIAVGAGGITGRGLGQGSQSQLRFLPEAETDFIFAVLAEELGFVGVMLLLGLFAIMYYRLLTLLWRSRNDFTSFIILGTIVLTAVEIFVNAGMTMGIFPVVGIPLPFVSAGGSSLVAHCMLFGVIENIARRERAAGFRFARVYAG